MDRTPLFRHRPRSHRLFRFGMILSFFVHILCLLDLYCIFDAACLRIEHCVCAFGPQRYSCGSKRSWPLEYLTASESLNVVFLGYVSERAGFYMQPLVHFTSVFIAVAFTGGASRCLIVLPKSNRRLNIDLIFAQIAF